jgi:adenylosuccinate lyase
VIERELERYLPFLATTKILMGLVRAGVGREAGHELVKEHAVAAALGLRAGAEGNELLDRLAADERVPLDRAALEALLGDPLTFVGAARRQVQTFVRAAAGVVAVHPEAALYDPGAIL